MRQPDAALIGAVDDAAVHASPSTTVQAQSPSPQPSLPVLPILAQHFQQGCGWVVHWPASIWPHRMNRMVGLVMVSKFLQRG